jgi:hypothetical protein
VEAKVVEGCDVTELSALASGAVSLLATVIAGIDVDDSVVDVVAFDDLGSGVTDLSCCEGGIPKNAAAVDVDVSAALRVLKAGGPVDLLFHAA